MAAKLSCILGVCSWISYASDTMLPQGADMVNILLGDTRIAAYDIRVLPGGNEVEFRGGIRAGAAKELQNVLNSLPQARVLRVNSIGGRLCEAQRMAIVVHERGLNTSTSDECLSGATLILLAGKQRFVAQGAKVGFHRPSSPGITEVQQHAADGATRQTMLAAGITNDFINRVLATPPEEMWYPSVEEMQRAGVITP